MAQFEKGQSGNPGGRPKTKELRELCRTYTEKAVNRLGELLDHDNAHVRMKAASELLDRGWGRPAQEVHMTDSESSEASTNQGREMRDKLFEIIERHVQHERETEDVRPSEPRFSRAGTAEFAHLKTGLGEDTEPSPHGGH